MVDVICKTSLLLNFQGTITFHVKQCTSLTKLPRKPEGQTRGPEIKKEKREKKSLRILITRCGEGIIVSKTQR